MNVHEVLANVVLCVPHLTQPMGKKGQVGNKGPTVIFKGGIFYYDRPINMRLCIVNEEETGADFG